MALEDLVIMGRIVAPYGVYGWIKVLPDTEEIDGLFDYETWWIGKDQTWRAYPVLEAKVHNDVLVVKLDGVNDRDMAFALKAQQVAVPRDALPEPEENAYYWSDLIGLKVTNTAGIDFGVVTQVFETGANDVLVVREQSPKPVVGKDGKTRQEYQERLIPFTDEAVPEVNLAAGTLLVDWDADF